MSDPDRSRSVHWAQRLLGTRSGGEVTPPPLDQDSPAGQTDDEPAWRTNDLAAHHRRTIDRGVRAMRDLSRAAEFATDGGVPDLDRAVQAAERVGADGAAARGRRVLDAFESFRRAAHGAGTDMATE